MASKNHPHTYDKQEYDILTPNDLSLAHDLSHKLKLRCAEMKAQFFQYMLIALLLLLSAVIASYVLYMNVFNLNNYESALIHGFIPLAILIAGLFISYSLEAKIALRDGIFAMDTLSEEIFSVARNEK